MILSHRPSNINGESFLDKSLTLQHYIIDAIWCDFTITDDTNQAISSSTDNDSHSNVKKAMKILKTLCILDDHYCLHILSDNGDYYQKNLPFRIGKMLATIEHGLLFERIIGSESKEILHYPAIYSLSNPLINYMTIILITIKNG